VSTALELYRVYWQRQIAIANTLGLPRPVIGGRMQRRKRVAIRNRIWLTKDEVAERDAEAIGETYSHVYEELRRVFDWAPSSTKEES